ncbi:MAG: tyrosine--tRNA ligase [Spirochaetes bacterium]|nr:tyrosine--tRNA ligase [Spirochaetota bacterium]
MDEKLKIEVKKQLEVITRNTEEIVPVEELEKKIFNSIKNNKPLRVKIGIDPTSPYVHIGHMVPYRKLREFQDLGHIAVLIIGDYTARIGDPTGRNSERPPLTPEEVRENAKSYTEQIFKVVREDRAEVHYQSEWFNDFDLYKVIRTASYFSVAQMLTHETFKKRLEEGNRLSLHEILYPMLQAYDSVAIKADVELGGTDQKFNILCGRDLMRDMNMEPQVAVLLPLLMGTNGIKMSKSLGNVIPILSSPKEKFGKVMSISDDLIINYMKYASNMSYEEIEYYENLLKEGKINPRDVKIKIAKSLVELYHTKEEAEREEEEFIRVFSKKEVPQDINIYKLKEEKKLIELLKELDFVPSLSEAKRLITQGGVTIDGERVSSFDYVLKLNKGEEKVIKAGKKNFIKIVKD